MKTVYEITVTRNWSDNAHKIAGFFPTSQMASDHIQSWPQFIRDSLSHASREVPDDFTVVPPEHMQNSIARAFYEWQNEQDHVPLIILQAVKDDPWDDWNPKPPHVHEWRAYVTDDLRGMWKTFNTGQRIAIAENAQRIADNEDWQ